MPGGDPEPGQLALGFLALARPPSCPATRSSPIRFGSLIAIVFTSAPCRDERSSTRCPTRSKTARTCLELKSRPTTTGYRLRRPGEYGRAADRRPYRGDYAQRDRAHRALPRAATATASRCAILPLKVDNHMRRVLITRDGQHFGMRTLVGPLTLMCAVAVLAAGCGRALPREHRSTAIGATDPVPAGERAARAGAAVPVAAGRSQSFRLAPRGKAADGQPIGRLRCLRSAGERELAHVELFASNRVVPVPPGIGVVPPLVRDAAYVLRARCTYPARTLEPTGIVEVRAGAHVSLGELFTIWGQPLSPTRLASFSTSPATPVRAYLDGRRWRADPGAVPLSRHAVVVLEISSSVPPHADYRFPPGR